MTTRAKHRTEKPVGICPACKQTVFADEPDGPVWTCPSDLNPSNPYYEELPEDYQTTEAQKEANGYYANCPDGLNNACPIEHYGTGHLPLHSACYEKGNY